MSGMYLNLDQEKEISKKHSPNKQHVFLYLLAQIIYVCCWTAIFAYTTVGYNLIIIRETSNIVFTISLLLTLISQCIMIYAKYINIKNLQLIAGIFLLIVNGFFLTYLMLYITFLPQPYSYQYYYVYAEPYWFLLGNIIILLIIFLLTLDHKELAWYMTLCVPVCLNMCLIFIVGYINMFYMVWLFTFFIVCLYLVEQDNEMDEFYVSLNILGFVTLFLIKTVEYIINSFRQQLESQFVKQLNEDNKLQYIFLTFTTASISFILTPQFVAIISFYDLSFFIDQMEISSNFWIFLSLNYSLQFILLITHRSLEIKYKSIIALLYFAVHQIYVSGLFMVTNELTPYYYKNVEYPSFYFTYLSNSYYVILIPQLQLLIGAITLQISQSYNLKQLYHTLILIPIILYLCSYFECDLTFIFLVIIVYAYLILYMGQLLIDDDNNFLQFKEDESLISGALFSDPLALYLYHSIYIHIAKCFK